MARLIRQITKNTVKTLLFVHETTFISMLKSKNSVRQIAVTHYYKSERKYTDKHEWMMLNGNIGTVGISNYAQDALGDVVYAQLPDVGSVVEKEGECGALESVKAASEIMSPCSGRIIEKNKAVENKPGLINSSCYDKGWLFKIELSNLDELKTLMDEDAYNQYLKSDLH
ncbi:PREDICTED: glycine cleavage system H protein, mitochondrial [Ceratosolen solmsi marchali]|uniref:Glycine cleavage system H protein n=1 Tax=Ceratosolen solmsi marchali TaxID=326594 RepID=A0AAJ6YT34_9HYME|nr:PREDICTED: glycine cleavage system H protein, mitochondrial [Ceratosolen solmsi marchali]